MFWYLDRGCDRELVVLCAVTWKKVFLGGVKTNYKNVHTAMKVTLTLIIATCALSSEISICSQCISKHISMHSSQLSTLKQYRRMQLNDRCQQVLCVFY